jgi:hypothetical protein
VPQEEEKKKERGGGGGGGEGGGGGQEVVNASIRDWKERGVRTSIPPPLFTSGGC